MATKTTAAQTAKIESANVVSNIFSAYETTRGIIGTSLTNEISTYVEGKTPDQLCVQRIVASFVKRVAYYEAMNKRKKKGETLIAIAETIAADYAKRVDAIIDAYVDEKEAEAKAMAKIAKFIEAGKTYYTVFNVAVKEQGGIAIARISDKLFRIAPFDDVKLTHKWISKETSAARTRMVKDSSGEKSPISEAAYHEKAVHVAILTNVPKDGKVVSTFELFRVNFDGSLSPIKDAYRGKTVSVWNGISNAVKAVM